MGQYHLTVNLTKREYIHPHKLGMGLKLVEQMSHYSSPGMGDVLMMLLASSNGRGGGDVETTTKGLVGRWAGDKIAVIGDYSEKGDIKRVDAKTVYTKCQEGEYTDISDEVAKLLNEQFGIGLNVAETGWRQRTERTQR